MNITDNGVEVIRDWYKEYKELEADNKRLRDALWVCVEHNRLYFGEQHNTVIQGRKALKESE